MSRASARSCEPTKQVGSNASGRLTKQTMWMPSACIARKVPLRRVACAGAMNGVGPLGMHGPQQRMLLVRVIGLFGHCGVRAQP
jgi:hypothetical protein